MGGGQAGQELEPSPEPVAEAICFALGQPADVDLNTLTVRPVGQPV